MAEYIDRQAAIDALGEEPEIWCETDEEAATRNQWERDKVAIEAVPPADVRPVVFCKDCAKAKTDTVDGAIYCHVWDMWEMPEKGFCYKGVKKKE